MLTTRPAAGGDHDRHHRLAAQEHAGEVDVDDLLPLVDAQLPDRRGAAGDTGVIDQRVDASPAIEGGADRGVPGDRLGDVELLSDPELANRRRGGLRGLVVNVRDHDRRAFAGEAPGDRFANPAGRSGNDRCLPLEPHRSFSSAACGGGNTPPPSDFTSAWREQRLRPA